MVHGADYSNCSVEQYQGKDGTWCRLLQLFSRAIPRQGMVHGVNYPNCSVKQYQEKDGTYRMQTALAVQKSNNNVRMVHGSDFLNCFVEQYQICADCWDGTLCRLPNWMVHGAYCTK
jgi:hypothetical protein